MNPATDAEFEEVLEVLDYEVLDYREVLSNRAQRKTFLVRRLTTGSVTGIDAEDYSSALFEAWHLVKPENQ